MPPVALVCPRCGSTHPPDERFCSGCGMPLVQVGGSVESAADERQRRARKIKPQYTEGALVRVAGASNQAEAEFIQGMLLEEGVPSLIRRGPGSDVPDFLAGGRRDVLVAQSGAPTAREVLAGPTAVGPRPGASTTALPVRLLACLLLAIVIAAVIIAVTAPLGRYVWG
jgi:zinc-ribbon domain